ncbi:MAG: valine--tRNA ligase [Ignavibacteria bacterium]|nr:valine--tRNA ligase [Ignavibacteria bacterium]
MDFPKNFDFNTIEQKWRDFWEERKLYESKPNPSKPKYSVVIPPPNVTGILHTGHMLNNTIQDVYCRMKRLEGFEVCWVPGMDHAGIATQVMVEKDLAGQGKKKEDLGREKFVELVWQWKEKNGGTILKQLRKLGASVDWSKERFTLDEGLSLNVRKVFVDLYKKGLIYRGNRIVNWDPVSKTAVSDDEMYYVERTDKLYFVKYLLENSDEFITVATTRPETLFGDTAVAVNPQDQRYNSFKNKKVRLPILNKLIPVVEDDYVDPEFGTGALKITPAHDLNDFEVGQRHGLPIINVLTTDSKLNEHAEEFSGLTVDDARIKVVERLQREGLLLKIEDYTHNVAVSDRTKAVIEPFLSEQWFVSMKELAQPAIEAVNSGQIKFYPDRYVKVYNHWMINIRDWCISRQLWWGHQIPIWYHNTTGEIYCEVEPPADPENWVQDEDVLDTWFSSWLWPLSVFGWENNEKDNENEDLKYYYPTDFLSTGNEIIFLWVARMIMAGLEYMKEIPFKDVYFHSIVRDSKGQKMSKTLGNYSDPIELMNTYGTDALRFTIVYLAPLGNDVLFDDEKTLIGRNFITKIWNAGRMLYMNRETELTKQTSLENSTKRFDIVDLWVNTKLNSVIAEAKGYLEQYRLNDYTKTLYNFVWNDFCDWYLEMLKVKIQKDPSNALESIGNAISIYEEILKILHPVIPFVTEELWHLMKDGREEQSISFEKIPDSSESLIDSQPVKDFEKITSLINSIRNLRANNELQFGKKIIAVFKPFDESSKALLESMQSYIEKLCNLEIAANTFEIGNLLTANTVSEGFEVQVFFEGNELDSKQAEKMQKDLENLQQYVASISKKLANQNFVSKAAPEVVTKEKEKMAEAEEKLLKIKSIIGKN